MELKESLNLKQHYRGHHFCLAAPLQAVSLILGTEIEHETASFLSIGEKQARGEAQSWGFLAFAVQRGVGDYKHAIS